MEEIFVGAKDISKYITACFVGLNKEGNKIKITSRGNYIKKSIDILAILTRDYLESWDYNIEVKSEPFENRYVSAVEIELSGIRKKEEK